MFNVGVPELLLILAIALPGLAVVVTLVVLLVRWLGRSGNRPG